MTLILSPQLEMRLINEARVNGMSPEDYAEMLLRRLLPDNLSEDAEPGQNGPRFGSARGKVIIADDFDEPLEDFKEYMY